jgi:hypothetical protein
MRETGGVKPPVIAAQRRELFELEFEDEFEELLDELFEDEFELELDELLLELLELEFEDEFEELLDELFEDEFELELELEFDELLRARCRPAPSSVTASAGMVVAMRASTAIVPATASAAPASVVVIIFFMDALLGVSDRLPWRPLRTTERRAPYSRPKPKNQRAGTRCLPPCRAAANQPGL